MPRVGKTGTAIRRSHHLTPLDAATMQLIAPDSETVKNTLELPDNIKVVSATATVESRTVKFSPIFPETVSESATRPRRSGFPT
jgi:hypothetical protein